MTIKCESRSCYSPQFDGNTGTVLLDGIRYTFIFDEYDEIVLSSIKKENLS